MELDHLFTTPIAMDHLAIDNHTLAQFCRDQIASTNPTKSNQSGQLDLTAPALQPLLSAVRERAADMWAAMDLNPQHPPRIRRAWTTLNNSSEVDLAHCHPDSILTAVYYVQGTGSPDNGNLILISPVTALQHVLFPHLVQHKNRCNSWNCAITPAAGKLVIFPAWIMHQVQRNRQDSDRLSIAIDIAA